MFYPNFIRTLVCAFVACSNLSTPPIDSDTPVTPSGQNIIVGYRTVSQAQAAEYNKAGTPVLNKPVVGIQLGNGVYTSPKAGDWLGPPGSWYCIIYADSDKFNAAAKAWIPKTSGSMKLWWNENNINSYIKSLGISDPSKTLRFSPIDGDDQHYQMLIPPALLSGTFSKPLGLTANCVDSVAKLPTNRVDYWSMVGMKGVAPPNPNCGPNLMEEEVEGVEKAPGCSTHSTVEPGGNPNNHS
ncbi:hypothetical protein Moror_11332 [Moniliophthora roreri MCA 2997]|uniref:Uncharacterized protein n=1 Tax=Moniliophthora roreri (strain MCA 2997) TaxID=1381753 RepID=V2WEM3_MONRO|nr:hypothetical protein Moror_11332 [Moniliophthora roreri MCA 2997]